MSVRLGMPNMADMNASMTTKKVSLDRSVLFSGTTGSATSLFTSYSKIARREDV